MGWRWGRSKVSRAGGSPEGWDVQVTCFIFYFLFFFPVCDLSVAISVPEPPAAIDLELAPFTLTLALAARPLSAPINPAAAS